MQNYTEHFGGKNAKQGEVIPGKEKNMTLNSCNNYVFRVGPWNRLERFLVLGSDKNTYYASAKKLTRENAAVIEELIRVDNRRLVDTIVRISDEGRAPNNDPALFALAMATVFGDKSMAMDALPKVARIGTHLLHYLEYTKGLGVLWRRTFRKGVANWFNGKDVGNLAYQAIKYKSRDGWSMRDALRLSHPSPKEDVARDALYHWIVKGVLKEGIPDQVAAAAEVMSLGTKDISRSAELIVKHRLPREALPTELLSDARIWDALLKGMPLGALVRNLGKMSSLGMLNPFSETSKEICRRLTAEEEIKKSRLHPVALLSALRVYKQGRGDKGSLSWSVNNMVSSALEDAFYLSFKTIVPTGKNIGLFLDVSGSMEGGETAAGLSPREASAVLAMVTARSEPNYECWAFSSGIVPFKLSKSSSLKETVDAMRALPFSSTDCSLPMTMATKSKIPLDAFIVYTDCETNHSGSLHPSRALQVFRQKMGRPAKLIVAGMVSNGFSIADPEDGGMLDVVGFDSSAPSVMADFVRD
jgi:60 kDa SS-A/Ro ribonucleoprotein